MRNASILVGVVIFAAACGGNSKPSTTGVGATGTGSGGEMTSGGTSGGTGGKLPSGATCSSSDACASGICGISDGGGNCCKSQCSIGNPICGASACDDSGNCVYPAAGLTCAPSTCASAKVSLQQCDGFGTCFINPATPCPNNFACSSDRTECNTTCKLTADCASGSFCDADAGTCLSKIATGACTQNAACTSGVCGLSGSGNCCTAACTITAKPCGATGCDEATGACVFPDETVLCGPGGTETCSGGLDDNPNVHCDGQGRCPPQTVACTPYVCGASSCFTSCTDDSSCVDPAAYCNLDAGACAYRVSAGPCTSNDACVTGTCGVTGIGNCCAQPCANVTPPCGATDCGAGFGECVYPGGTTLCGSIPESCSGTTQQNPSACDGNGGCNNSPGTTDCTPFICGQNACLNTCTDNSSCVGGDVCDTSDSTCCAPLASGGTITVDGVLGNDTNGCCGYGSAGACKTVSHAMELIDIFQIKNVTINASVGGGGGDWPGGAEVYPIVLGWGAELKAPGVYFLDRNGANKEILDIAQYSANDSVGYASIVGGAGNEVGIGLNTTDTNQLSDQAAVRVEAGQTLYIANAVLNSSALGTSSAIVVSAGAGLVLGEDQPASVKGTVTIGNESNKFFTDGWDGIVCETGNSKGCTITDAPLTGKSSIVIKGQEDLDISAQDFANITLTSAPTIGVAPAGAGFGQCPSTASLTASSPSGKPDTTSSRSEAVLLQGQATMTFKNGTVQCISGTGFLLEKSPNKNGNPSLTLENSTIQNTEQAVLATAGTAAISGCTIQFNYNGVEQSHDAVNTATLDLSGDGTDAGANAVVCSGGRESIYAVDGGTAIPGVDVLNNSGSTLKADNVAWDTSGPDLFSCDAQLTSCTCQLKSCTNAGGVDDMDAVDESTGTITTTGNTVSSVASDNGCN